MDDDDVVTEMFTPSHGKGQLKPFTKGDPRTREMARKGAAATARKNATEREAIEAEKLALTATASARREMASMLRMAGIHDADEILRDVQARPEIVGQLAKAMAVSVLSRILADEFPIKSAGEAIKLVEIGVKIHRLEMGQATEIIESDDDKLDRIRATVRAARSG